MTVSEKALETEENGEDNGEIETLWHYCSNEAFLSILKTKELWLSEVTHSNDYMEGRWLLENVLRNKLLAHGMQENQVNDVIRSID